MKKWQKAVGIIAFALIVIYELLIWVNAYIDMKYIVESNGNNFLTERMYMRIGSLSFGMWLNFFAFGIKEASNEKERQCNMQAQ